MENIYVYAFATFGHPNDFNQVCFLPEERKTDLNLKSFDLSNAIKVFPNSELYSIRKESVNGINLISYSKYTFAKEKLSDRDGTFVGTSIVFSNLIAEENVTIRKLNEFHEDLIKKNVIEGRLIVNHSKDFLMSRSVTKDFEKLNYNLKKNENITNFGVSNSNLVVFSNTDSNALKQNFTKSLELLNSFDTIFFTQSKENFIFCRNRGLYKTIDEEGFIDEIQVLRNEKIRKTKALVYEFEKEISELEENKRATIKDFKFGIEQNQKLHQENIKKIEESKKQVNIIESKYENYAKKIKEAINYINSNQNFEKIALFHNQNKREFIDFINQNKNPNYLNNLKQVKPQTDLRIQNQNHQTGHQKYNKIESEKSPPNAQSNIYKLLSVIFCILWLGTLVFYLIMNKKTEINSDEPKTELYHEKEFISEDSATSPELSPKPNEQLSQKDYKIVANSLKHDMSLEEVVKIIFEKNPSDIEKYYESQIIQYSKEIIEKNKNCFEEKAGKKYFSRDTIKIIPSFKTKD